MVCFHRRYDLGDKHDYNHNDYDSWEEMEKDIIKREDVAVILPLSLYDHSGISMSVGSPTDRWDSGYVGFIFISKAKALKEYGGKIVTKKLKERLVTYLTNEVETYNQYLRGEVYCYEVEKAVEMVKLSREDFNNGRFEDVEDEIEWEFEDSCSGFYGDDAVSISEHSGVPLEVVKEAMYYTNIDEWIEFDAE
jgi:hypothetical protein